MVGLGFAMTENFLYYGKALASGGVGGALVVFILRGVMSPLSHPLFTSMTGIGLGWSRQSDSTAVKVLAPVGGLFLAMFLHFAWNGTASLGAAFLLAYVVFFVPVLLGVAGIVYFSLRSEAKIVHDYLWRDVKNGLMSQADLQALSTVSGRTRHSWQALVRGGVAGWRERGRLHQLATEVALYRRRVERGQAARDDAGAELEAAYVRLLHAGQGIA